MLSVVMPYWKREKLLGETLDRYEKLYAGLTLEVIVANDGSETPVVPRVSFPVTVIDLPKKTEAKNPCVPLNAGARIAKGSVLVITNPENYHTKPLFPEMVLELLKRGSKGYVLAACKGEKRWHCHSRIRGPGQDRIPEGSGLHFCAMMHRKFFDEVGGFDEDYRDGSGYEDNDFAWRVHRAGGDAVVRDDLVVKHPTSNTKWPKGGFNRNRQIFYNKWTDYWNQL